MRGQPVREQLVEKPLARGEQSEPWPEEKQSERDGNRRDAPARREEVALVAQLAHTVSSSEMVLIRCEDWIGLEM